MGKRVDLSGMKFGKLTVLSKAESLRETSGAIRAMWTCKCDCGTIVAVRADTLRLGKTKSCGCYRKDILHEQKTIHGLSRHKLRSVWRNMLARCENPKTDGYKNYGGRGITVCKEWHNLKMFSEWAFISGYQDGLTIERIDVNGKTTSQVIAVGQR